MPTDIEGRAYSGHAFDRMPVGFVAIVGIIMILVGTVVAFLR